MVYELFGFYKEKLSFWNVYFKHMIKWLVVSLFLTAVVISLGLLFVSFWSEVQWFILLAFIPNVLLMLYVKREKGRIAKEVYNQDSPKGVFNKRKEEFADYLEQKGIVEPHQFEYLIELIDKNAQDLKVPFLINWGLIAAVIAPIWIQYITYIFTNEINSLEEATVSLGLLYCLLYCCYMLVRSLGHSLLVN
ncbi:hypothetical protein MUO14_16950 [Halobacillus shinanisalinarum]|uniref:Uncharacterized protein n=1 Tax=Halobacillus shinanisalinarum TaxID=2932258 RepID=A0ABY4GW30_9BACI|nr:hypothetical protein [Halobacillus shinanisalinarum]UOQ92166.1 hypothetical protein MUO14_16950 [Halobacillus shinanisalinarum]